MRSYPTPQFKHYKYKYIYITLHVTFRTCRPCPIILAFQPYRTVYKMEPISDDDDDGAWDDDSDVLGETRGRFDLTQHPAHVAVCANDIARL